MPPAIIKREQTMSSKTKPINTNASSKPEPVKLQDSPINVAIENQPAKPPRQTPERFIKSNYYKYHQVIKPMINMLDGTFRVAEIVEALHISQQTLFKYKALAQLESDRDLMTLEEKIQLDKNRNRTS